MTLLPLAASTACITLYLLERSARLRAERNAEHVSSALSPENVRRVQARAATYPAACVRQSRHACNVLLALAHARTPCPCLSVC
jgi:hypothetical protein